MMSAALRDWTCGHSGLVLYRCRACTAAFYFERGFCPSCGSRDVVATQACGGGIVLARTAIHRAPREALRGHLPYSLVLVQLEEGHLVMGHGDPALRIDDAVCATFVAFGDVQVIPFFRAQGDQA
jgi:uncharacterized OB-fold protein